MPSPSGEGRASERTPLLVDAYCGRARDAPVALRVLLRRALRQFRAHEVLWPLVFETYGKQVTVMGLLTLAACGVDRQSAPRRLAQRQCPTLAPQHRHH